MPEKDGHGNGEEKLIECPAMNNRPQPHIVVDVESDGQCPGLYSMLSIGLVRIDDLDNGFYAELRPISDRYDTAAMSVGGFTREKALEATAPEQAMASLLGWVEKQGIKGRPIVWSDNPAFDWQFLNYYCHAFLGHNPFGHSARRIGDVYSGWRRNLRETKDWRRWRGEPHTHNALDDARGNARALAELISRMGNSLPRRD